MSTQGKTKWSIGTLASTLLTAIGSLFGVCGAGSQASAQVVAQTQSATTTSVEVLDAADFKTQSMADTEAVMLDVRRPEEYEQGHIAKAVNIDWLSRESFETAITKLDKAKRYYIYCRSGRRSNAAAQRMQQLGFDVRDLKGGFLAWQAAGLPVVK